MHSEPWWRKRHWRLLVAVGLPLAAVMITAAVCGADFWLEESGQLDVPDTIVTTLIYFNCAFATVGAVTGGVLASGKTSHKVLAGLRLGIAGFVVYLTLTPLAVLAMYLLVRPELLSESDIGF